MADSPYFDGTYFDSDYFDTGSAAAGHRLVRLPEPPPPPLLDDGDELFALI